MKILIEMPLDEKWSLMSQGIWRCLPNEVKQQTFVMPMYMDYLVSTKISKNWLEGLFDCIISAEKIYEATSEDDNLVIIGNMPKKYAFDATFNFQDEFEEMAYEDFFVKKIKEIIEKTDFDAEEKKRLLQHLDLHESDESLLNLINFAATADFITAYLQSEVKLNKIKEEYMEKLNRFKK